MFPYAGLRAKAPWPVGQGWPEVSRCREGRHPLFTTRHQETQQSHRAPHLSVTGAGSASGDLAMPCLPVPRGSLLHPTGCCEPKDGVEGFLLETASFLGSDWRM